MAYNDIPINKTAALVTNQKNCTEGEALTRQQITDNLRDKLKSIEIEILSLPKGSERRAKLGQKKQEIAMQLNLVRPPKQPKGVANYVVDVIKEEMTGFQYRQIMKKAYAKMHADKNKVEEKK